GFGAPRGRYYMTPLSFASLSHTAVLPVARKRRDSKHPPSSAQALCENILKNRAPARAGFGNMRHLPSGEQLTAPRRSILYI
ncbi:hypothetical protein KDW49_26030, partial [Burkholderia dolosa]|uniref:hypothetical protein n=1 Tax=Burkholderia dolosa TaxID=152500 RepID=UPI001B9F2500